MPLDEFDIEKNIKKIPDLENKINKLMELEDKLKSISDLEAELKITNRQLIENKERVHSLENVIKEKDEENLNLKEEISDLRAKNQDLINDIENMYQERPKMKINDLTNHFKEVINKINTSEIKSGEAGVMIENLEVEIKGGMDMTDDLYLTQIPGQQLSPESISRIKFSLRPTPTIKIAE